MSLSRQSLTEVNIRVPKRYVNTNGFAAVTVTVKQPTGRGIIRLCLHLPENLPPHANFSHELAVQMLERAISLAEQAAF